MSILYVVLTSVCQNFMYVLYKGCVFHIFQATSPKKMRAIRKINFDVDTTSPVSGTIITKEGHTDDSIQGKVRQPYQIRVYTSINIVASD